MLLLVLLFIVIPVAELWLIIQIGGLIGVLPTLALLLADALLGALLLRHQGRAAWRRFNAALEERRFPGREVADGVMITFGGALLLTPGFITDVAGVLLLLPPTRALIRRALFSYLRRRFRVVETPTGFGYGAGHGAGGPDPFGRAYDIEGTAEEVKGNGSRPHPDDRESLPPA